MSSVICPHCRNEIHVRFFTPKKLTCPTCHAVFIAEYNDENGDPHPGGIEGFKAIHPKLTKTASVGVKVGFGVLLVIGFKGLIEDKINELTDPLETSSESGCDTSSCGRASELSDSLSQSDDEPLSYNTKDVTVEGCKVRLPPNRHPSQQKRETAAANGYDLKENETWRVSTSRTLKVSVKDE